MSSFNINISNSKINNLIIDDSYDGWQDADLTIINFALPRIKKLKLETTTYPNDFKNIDEWKFCLTCIILELKSYLEDRSSNLSTFKKWFNHLWL